MHTKEMNGIRLTKRYQNPGNKDKAYQNCKKTILFEKYKGMIYL